VSLELTIVTPVGEAMDKSKKLAASA